MRFDWAVGLNGMAQLFTGAWLCLYAVHERLRVNLRQVMLFMIGIMLSYGLLAVLLKGSHLNLMIMLLLPPCFYCFQRVVQVGRSQLLFLFLAVSSLISFSSSLALILDCGRGATFSHMLNSTLLYQVGVLGAGIGPASYLLRRWVWPVIRDLDAPEWHGLWIIPLVFTGTMLVISGGMEETPLETWQYHASIMLLSLGAFTSYYLIMRMMHRTAASARMAENARMMEQLLLSQRAEYERLSAGIVEARKARHDLRHSLAVLQRYVHEQDLQGMLTYLNQLTGTLPMEGEGDLCANYVVNAVARHYMAAAEKLWVKTVVRLDIPAALDSGFELDLCVLIGNLLENAVEASTGIAPEQREIHFHAAMEGEYLAVKVTNRFDGVCWLNGEAYLSRKHKGEGIGISSVRAVVQKYGGYARFDPGRQLFEASVVVRLFGFDENAWKAG